MTGVSDRLRTARERAGLTIEDISRRTKIKAVQLQAIDRGEFERLPGEFFTRAFLRNYAREVGIAPDEIVREYDAARGVPERIPDPASASAAPARAARSRPEPGRDPGHREYVDQDDAGPLLSFARTAWPVLAMAVIVLVVISLVNRRTEGSGEAGAVSATGPVAGRPEPAPTSGTAEARPAAAPEMLSMEIQPTAEIWINAQADGQRAIYRLVKPGERLKLQARSDLTFRVGNAGAFQYTINGVPGRPVGGPGEVREFQITRHNVQTYHR